VYVGADGVELLCLKAATGALDWSFTVGAAVRGTASADAARVYAVSMDNLLRTFRRSNGALVWKQDVGYRPSSGPIVVGPTVAVPGRSASVRVFAGATGGAGGQLALPDPMVSAPAVARAGPAGQVVMAVVTGDPGKPWLLSLASPPPPGLPALTPLTVLPGEVLPPVRLPGS
jgi:outer membrane protein assembly factor BamB